MQHLLRRAAGVALAFGLSALPVLAADTTVTSTGADLIKTGLANAGGTAGYQETVDLPTLIGTFVNLLFSVSGLILVCMLVYGGFLYLTDVGGGESVKKAKSLIRNAITGIIIMASAYTITYFVLTKIQSAASGTTS